MGESETRVSADMRREEEGFKVWRLRYLAETTHSQEEAFQGFRGIAGYPGGKARYWLLVLVGHEVEQLLTLMDQRKAES